MSSPAFQGGLAVSTNQRMTGIQTWLDGAPVRTLTDESGAVTGEAVWSRSSSYDGQVTAMVHPVSFSWRDGERACSAAP